MSTRAPSQASVDSAPWLSLVRSSSRPSRQPPVAGSASARPTTLWPRNQLKASHARSLHVVSPVVWQASMQAATVACASMGCWSKVGAGAPRRRNPRLPTGAKRPVDDVWIVTSQSSIASPASSAARSPDQRPLETSAWQSRALSYATTSSGQGQSAEALPRCWSRSRRVSSVRARPTRRSPSRRRRYSWIPRMPSAHARGLVVSTSASSAGAKICTAHACSPDWRLRPMQVPSARRVRPRQSSVPRSSSQCRSNAMKLRNRPVSGTKAWPRNVA